MWEEMNITTADAETHEETETTDSDPIKGL